MKKAEKIKELEHELGRYRKKFGGLSQEIAQLKAGAKGYTARTVEEGGNYVIEVIKNNGN